LRQSLGLGKGGKIRSLEVFWPTTGETQRFENVPENQLIRITEGKNDFAVIPLKTLTYPSVDNEPAPPAVKSQPTAAL
jgi:hypothetical protein